MILTARGNPVGTTESNESPVIRHDGYPGNDSNTEDVTHRPDCQPVKYEMKDVTILQDRNLFLKGVNITVPSSRYRLENGSILACISFHPKKESLFVLNCTRKFEYTTEDYSVLPNMSARVGKNIVPLGEYEMRGEFLLTCAPEEEADFSTGITLSSVSIKVGQIGSVISIVFLLAHLVIFLFLPSLRNLPGCNLAALSVAFLLAYFFLLIGQIPQVLGLSCVISAVLQQNFFLAAFFCTNVMAFDVWRTLKLATEKLVIRSQSSGKRQFVWYSLYAWGGPLIITTISVIVDNYDGIPEVFKPGYGKYDICWMNNRIAKIIFFVVPSFTLLIVNAVFFILTFFMIFNNKMKTTNDQSKQNVKLNYILYVRLALMMGLTWLTGVIAFLVRNDVLWFLFDLLNSLQGLFLFIFFTCTKKVVKQLKEKSSTIKFSSSKQATLTTNSSFASSKTNIHGMKISQSSLSS